MKRIRARGEGGRGRRWRALVVGPSAALLVAAALSGGAEPSLAAGRDPHRLPYQPGEALVRFRAGTSLSAMEATHAAVGATVLQTFRSVSNLQLVQVHKGMAVWAAVARYRARPEVRYAQPNYRYWVNRTPNDPEYPDMYNLNNTGQTGGTPDADVDAPEAWDITTGSTRVVVGSIDTGVDYSHPDLRGRVSANKPECRGTRGVDDDGDGYVDDCHGIDTYNHDSNPMDDFTHGTHTSGTMGAVGDNGLGVVGVNWNVTILACKSHNASGLGTVASIIECFQYMDTMKEEGLNIVATNNSYGGCTEACGYDQATYDAILSNMRHGILFAVSAGNSASDNDVTPVYPASYFLPNVISVAATDDRDGLAFFSNYGNESVYLGAPGQSILSTLLGGGYGYLTGTSMAAPHVAGLAGLLYAQDHHRSWKDIRNLILAGGDSKSGLVGKTVTSLRMNAYGSMTCNNRHGFGILQPLPASQGPTITVAALNINCALPAATTLDVTVTPGGDVVTLVDDGTGGDVAKSDGTLTGQWTPSPCVSGTYTFTFPNGRFVRSQVTC